MSRLCDAPHRRTGARLLEVALVVGKSQFRDDSKQSPRSTQCRPHHRPQAAQAGGGIVLLTCTGATLELGALGESLHVYVYCCID